MRFMPTWFVLAALSCLPVLAWPFSMELPVNCTGTDLCLPQNYFDHDPSAAYADYTCGPLSYDAHTGTDIRVSYADMERGVPVLSAADGVVRAVRDGEPEGEISLRGRETVRGREAGNAVVVAHAEGFETQYSHLKKGSVVVRPGQQVGAGLVLGRVGLSGATEFPHLEISVRSHGRPVDPYIGSTSAECAGPRAPLWSRAALASPELAYRAGGLLDVGFFNSPPKNTIALLRRQGQIEAGTDDLPALIFAVMAFGPRKGDIWAVRLTGPDGSVLAESRSVQERDQAQAMRYVGKKRGPGWKPGLYRGEFRLTRPGEEEVVAVVREIEVP